MELFGRAGTPQIYFVIAGRQDIVASLIGKVKARARNETTDFSAGKVIFDKMSFKKTVAVYQNDIIAGRSCDSVVTTAIQTVFNIRLPEIFDRNRRFVYELTNDFQRFVSRTVGGDDYFVWKNRLLWNRSQRDRQKLRLVVSCDY